MNMFISIILFLVGLGFVIYFAEKLVKGVIGTSIGFGISAFIVIVIFIGFDPENLAVGAVGAFEDVAGMTLGSIIGAAMVAIALAFGIAALLTPMKFKHVPKQIHVVPFLAVLLLGILGFDGLFSRINGVILLISFAVSVFYLIFLSKKVLT